MSISEQLKKIISEYNIDQKQLAKIAGVTEGAVSQWLSGITVPKMGRLQKIANHFNKPISTLVDENSFKEEYSDEISFNDFDFALKAETKDLTEEQKNMLLSMAKMLKEQNK